MDALAIQAIRRHFASLDRHAYLNFGGAGPSPEVVLAAVVQSLHTLQQVGPFSVEAQLWVEQEIAETRRTVEEALLAPPGTVVLTEGVAAACYLVLWGLDWRPGDELILTDCENPAVHAAVECVSSCLGIRVRTLPVMGLPLEEILRNLRDVLRSRSRLLIASHVSWVTGQVLPLSRMAEVCRALVPDIAILADGAQAFGCLPIDVRQLQCDFYAFTGSKWACGPEGVGGIYIAPEWIMRLRPSLSGSRALRLIGSHLEWRPGIDRFEGGTRPYALYSGLRSALLFHRSHCSWQQRQTRVSNLQRCLKLQFDDLRSKYPDQLEHEDGGALQADGIFSFGVRAHSCIGLVHHLELHGVLVREIPGKGLVRVCMHYFTSEEDIFRLVESIDSFLRRGGVKDLHTVSEGIRL
jgi:L-cysteine/cystine lyase